LILSSKILTIWLSHFPCVSRGLRVTAPRSSQSSCCMLPLLKHRHVLLLKSSLLLRLHVGPISAPKDGRDDQVGEKGQPGWADLTLGSARSDISLKKTQLITGIT
jgi:hypothetical protein